MGGWGAAGTAALRVGRDPAAGVGRAPVGRAPDVPRSGRVGEIRRAGSSRRAGPRSLPTLARHSRGADAAGRRP